MPETTDNATHPSPYGSNRLTKPLPGRPLTEFEGRARAAAAARLDAPSAKPDGLDGEFEGEAAHQAYQAEQSRRLSGDDEQRQLAADIMRGRRATIETGRDGAMLGDVARRQRMRAVELRACCALYQAAVWGELTVADDEPLLCRAWAEMVAGIRDRDDEGFPAGFAKGYRGLGDRARWSDTAHGRTLMERAEAEAIENTSRTVEPLAGSAEQPAIERATQQGGAA